MTHFHPQQSDRSRCRFRNANGTLKFRATNCTTNLHTHIHEVRKIVCNNLSSAVQAHVMELPLYTKQALPLSFVRFLRLANGSSKNRRSPARRSRNGRESSGKTSGQMSRSFLHIYRAIAGLWQMQCRRISARQLARQLVSWRATGTQCPRRSPRNSRCDIPRNVSQDDCSQFRHHDFKPDSQKI